MTQRTRGSESTCQVIVDGDLKGGSFSRVLDWSITPRQSVEETGFQGELEDDLDFQHMGYDFEMSLQEMDRKIRDLLFTLVAREQARTAYPDIQIVLTIKHRAGNDGSETLVLENVVLKVDSIGSGSKKDFITSKISGKFKTLARA